MNRTTTGVDSSHRQAAEELLSNSYGNLPSERESAAAQVHATLAQVDAIEALTAAIVGRELPTLELAKVGGGRFDPQYRIRPVKP